MACVLYLAAAARLLLPAQDPDAGAPPRPAQAGLRLDRTLPTLHGVVRNAVTGEPIARALVRLEGDAATGALTDAQGRFEIPGIPVGPQALDVRKPGYLDRSSQSAAAAEDGFAGPAHNVLVAVQMPDLVFKLTPAAAIHGQVDLSTGAPAGGIGIVLLRRIVQDGRGAWQTAAVTKTRSNGAYRFAGLPEGDYALQTQPAMDSEPPTTIVEPGAGGAVQHWGYAGVFYPGARDFSGATQIHLAPGQDAQASLLLALEPFYPVVAQVALPGGARYGAGNPAWAGMNIGASLVDAQGRVLPYSAQYDPGTHTVQALLPNGGYTLLVTVTASRLTADMAGNHSFTPAMDNGPFGGEAEVSVAGRAVAGLRVNLAGTRGAPVQSTVLRMAGQPASGPQGTTLVMVSPASQIGDGGMVAAFASGTAPGPLGTAYTPPGSYWVHTHVGQKGLCESSFTAGGASLAREPLLLGLAGAAASLDLTLRDDCARLTLSLPPDAAAIAAGEEPFYTVYVVPDFDTTTDPEPLTLRASTGGRVTLADLTPGGYHVYTFPGPMRLEYRNRDAMAALPRPGQPLALAPGTDANLVIEAPAP